MQEYLTNTSELKSIADAIRQKARISASLSYPEGFISGIQMIPSEPVYQNIEVTPLETAQIFNPTSGYDAISVAHINAIPSNYVGTGIPRRFQSNVLNDSSIVTLPVGYYSSAFDIYPKQGSMMLQNAVVSISSGTLFLSDYSYIVDGRTVVDMIATYNGSAYISMNASEGWVSQPAYGTFNYVWSSTYQFSTQPAITVIPNDRSQVVVKQGQLITGNIVVASIPSNFIGSQVSRLAAQSFTPGLSDMYIPAGYYLEGDQTILGDPNLVPENIKSGISLYGVTGVYMGEGETTPIVVEDMAVSSSGIRTFIPYSLSGTVAKYYYNNSRVSQIAPYRFKNTIVINVSFVNCLSVGSFAFASCKSLSFVNLPICKYIDEGAFISCTSLKNITLPECQYIGINAFSFTGLNYISAPKCTTIGARAFNSAPLYELNLPMCEEIGVSAFCFNYLISSISLPAVKLLNAGCFFSCRSISEVNLPVCETINANTFYYCTNINNVSIPLCSYIGDAAFMNCHNLSFVYAPSCLYVGISAFYECRNLQSVIIDECISIDNRAFTNADITSIYLPKCKTIGQSAFSGASLQTISLPSCDVIENYAFTNCRYLKEAILPECKSLNTCAFSGCANLSYVYAPKCSALGYSVFYNAFGSLSEPVYLSFPVCEQIYISCFYSCHNLSSVYFPSCTTIGDYAFEYSTLVTGSFPKCLTIGRSAFCGCSMLTSIDFPECTLIQSYAFSTCSFLSIAIFRNLVSTSTYCFRYCYRLLSFYCLGETIPTINPSIFDSTPISNYTEYTNGEHGYIYVLASMVDTFKSAAGWSQYSSYIMAYEEV